MSKPNVLDELEWRGLVAHSTDRDALRAAFDEGTVKFYVGFDPTAPSLHLGNLVQIVTAMRLQRAGHTPYLLVGGRFGGALAQLARHCQRVGWQRAPPDRALP